MMLRELIVGIVPGNIGDEEFPAIALMVILTTLMTTPILALLIGKAAAQPAE